MKLSRIIPWSENFTDEVQTNAFAISFANKAIAKINIECGLILPFLDTVEDDYTAMPDSWFVELLTTYLNYGIKMNDASLTEAREYRMDFEVALTKFRDVAQSIIADEYLDDSNAGAYIMDTSNAIDIGWFHR